MAYKPKEIEKFKGIILDRLVIGKSLNSLVNKKIIPSHQTIYNWLNEEHKEYDKEFLDNYRRAREAQADFYADEMIEIADTEKDPNKARVRLDARKWVSSKLKPKKYGDKLDMTSGGEKMELRIGSVKVIKPDESND